MYVPKTPTLMKGVFNNHFTAAEVCGFSVTLIYIIISLVFSSTFDVFTDLCS